MDEVVRLKAKIYENNILDKYEAIGTIRGESYYLSVDQVKLLASRNLVYGVKLDSKHNRLYGTKEDLRKLKRVNKKFARNIVKSMPNVLVGIELKSFVARNIKDYNERYVVSDIMKFCTTHNNIDDHKICIVYGLRRTGKTIAMLHTINKLRDYSRSAYVSLNSDVSVPDLFQILNKLLDAGIKYVFLDEISEINGIILGCAQLSDFYAKMGLKVIISGTDLLLLELMSYYKLYDRCIKIHTTYIGYKEYNYIFNNNVDIMDYIRRGGVLVRSTFYDDTHTNDYVNSAISDNIRNSLVRSNNKHDYQNLIDLNFRGLLKKAIEQSIASSNEELTSRIIAEEYKNGDLGSAKQLVEQQFNINISLDTFEIEELVRYYLGIARFYDRNINDECIKDLKYFFEVMGILKTYTRYADKRSQMVKVEANLFVQPGLRYNQCLVLFRSMLDSDSYRNLRYDVREALKNKLIEDLEGHILEHTVIIAMLEKQKEYKGLNVTQFRFRGMEVDIAVKYKDNVELYEVKRNKNIAARQYKWLINKEFCDKIEYTIGGKVKNRYVLYLGEKKDIVDGDYIIKYRNISDFLKRL